MGLEVVRKTDSLGVTMCSLPTKHFQDFLADNTGTDEWTSVNGKLNARHARSQLQDGEFTVFSGPLFQSKPNCMNFINHLTGRPNLYTEHVLLKLLLLLSHALKHAVMTLCAVCVDPEYFQNAGAPVCLETGSSPISPMLLPSALDIELR